jgi:hypothetical protein
MPSSKKRRPKKGASPANKRRRRNPQGGRVFSHEVHYLAYRHADDGEPYKHKFEKGVTMAAASDGSIVLYRPDGKPVWGDF